MEGNKPSSIFTCFLKCSWFFLFFYSLFWSIFDEIFWSSWKKTFSRARCFYLFIHFISLVSFYTPWKLKYEEFFVMVFRWTRWFHNGLYAGVKSFPCFQQIPYHFSFFFKLQKFVISKSTSPFIFLFDQNLNSKSDRPKWSYLRLLDFSNIWSKSKRYRATFEIPGGAKSTLGNRVCPCFRLSFRLLWNYIISLF